MSQNDLNHLIGRVVQVNRKGPDSFKGQLIDLKSDYLVLNLDNARVYLPTYHIRSIGIMTNDHSNDEVCNFVEVYNHPECFADLVQSFKHQWVQIDGGPNKVEGIPVDSSCENVILSVKDQVMSIVLSHIKNLVIKKQGKQENNESHQQPSSESPSETVPESPSETFSESPSETLFNPRRQTLATNTTGKEGKKNSNDINVTRIIYTVHETKKKQNKQKSAGNSKKNTRTKRG